MRAYTDRYNADIDNYLRSMSIDPSTMVTIDTDLKISYPNASPSPFSPTPFYSPTPGSSGSGVGTGDEVTAVVNGQPVPAANGVPITAESKDGSISVSVSSKSGGTPSPTSPPP